MGLKAGEEFDWEDGAESQGEPQQQANIGGPRAGPPVQYMAPMPQIGEDFDYFDRVDDSFHSDYLNLLNFKSACLFNKTKLYEDDFLEIDIKSQPCEPNNTQSVKFQLSYICKSPKKMFLSANVDSLKGVHAVPKVVEKLFDIHSQRFNQEIILTKDTQNLPLVIPAISISYKIEDQQDYFFTIFLPSTINKFLFAEKSTFGSIDNFLKDKELLNGLEFPYNTDIIREPEYLPKIVDEIAEIVPGTFAAVYRAVGEGGATEEFAAQIQFLAPGEMLINVWGKSMSYTVDEYLRFFEWVFGQAQR